MKTFYLFVFSLFISTSLFAQNRVEKPLQIHLNASGVFLKAFGNAISDSEIEELSIKKWELPGVSLGYHINNRIYLGYAFQPNRNLILKEPWSFGNEGTDGNIIVDHNTGNFHTLEGRYFPFKFDLYGSVLLTHVSKADYQMDFTRTANSMTVGENQYETDINAK